MPALVGVLAKASAQSGRDYQVALSGCRHPRARITTGLVWDSTGFTSEPPQEPDFVRERVEDAGFSLLTDEIACTEYYRPPGSDAYLQSILDHVVASGESWQAAEAQGLCERLACEVTEPEEMDPDFEVVSDHCPVVVEGTPG